jgi:hypothetical protein
MKRILTIIGAAVALTACGGGGDDAPSQPAASASAEGFWTGTATTGTDVSLAVLENGETWGVYSSGGLILGALYGQTTSSGTTLNGAGSDFNIPSGTVASASYTGTYTKKSRISVRTSGGVSFTGTYDSDYDVTPSLANLVGSFRGSAVSGNASAPNISVSFSPTGAFTVPASFGCSASGIVSPRQSGKNIFNVNITFSGSTCDLGNGGTTSGIAYYDTTTRQILVATLNNSKTQGLLYLGTKSPS